MPKPPPKAKPPAPKRRIKAPAPTLASLLNTAPLGDDPPVDVAATLAQARALHTQFHAVDRTRASGRVAQMKTLAAEALALRNTAHEADPDYLEAAWSLDLAPDAQIRTFFSTFIARH